MIAIAITPIALAITATSAIAATTRAEWVAQIDPICQSGQAQEQALLQPLVKATKRVGRNPKRNSGRKLARVYRTYFLRYANIERAVNTQIATIPPAPDDISLVQVWLRARGELVDLETRLFTQRGNGKKALGKLFSSIFVLAAKQLEVTDLVRDFGFQYCNQGDPELQIIV